MHTPTYHLLPADLRLSPSVTLDNLLASPTTDSTTKPILSPSLPTLLLFECVLVYMSPSHSSALLQWFAGYFSSSQDGAALGSIVYEMFGLKDAFGRVMVNNLKVYCPRLNTTWNGDNIYNREEMSLSQGQSLILPWTRFCVGFWIQASRPHEPLRYERSDKNISLVKSLTGGY